MKSKNHSFIIENKAKEKPSRARADKRFNVVPPRGSESEVDPPALVPLPLQDPAVGDAGVRAPAARVEGEALGPESPGDRHDPGSVEAVLGSRDGRRAEEVMGRRRVQSQDDGRDC